MSDEQTPPATGLRLKPRLKPAEGDTPPLRVIRASPAGVPALMIGNPGGLAYDSSREEILAPN